MDLTPIVLILAALFIALVMTFAQVKLFSIDTTLKEIKAQLEKR